MRLYAAYASKDTKRPLDVTPKWYLGKPDVATIAAIMRKEQAVKDLLYVDACVNRKTSRTERLAEALLARLATEQGYAIERLVLEDAGYEPFDGRMIEERTQGTLAGDFQSPVFDAAKRFARADVIVFAAPYWDFSFPSRLKVYLEHLCSQGVTFTYSPEGIPAGLVAATKAFYVTTSGGYIGERDYGYAQVRDICQAFFGIPSVMRFGAEGLDIVSNDAEDIMARALAQIAQAEL